MRDLETSSLRIFQTVARIGNVSRAAKELHYVQSNVSARIQQLEEDLGTPLFYRKSRGMVLTPAGQVLKDHADRVLHLVGEARKAVHDSLEYGGTLTIGALASVAAVQLPPILTRFHKAYPKVDIKLVTGLDNDLIKDVLGVCTDDRL